MKNHRIPDDMITGTIHETINNGSLEIIKYHGAYEIDILFVDTGSKRTVRSSDIRKREVKDFFKPTVFGVGFIGDRVKRTPSNRQPKSYFSWIGMLERCYSDKKQNGNPTYIGCSVDPIWHNFQNFAKWFDDNYIDGYHLDKDILHQGNKIYSPKNCLFVSQRVNNLLLESNASRGDCLIGVSFDKGRNKYHAQCKNNGKKASIGRFTSESLAHQAYKKYKYAVIKEVASKQSEPLRSALLAYRIE